jgi:hypothetical protein
MAVFTSKWWIEEHKQLEDRGGFQFIDCTSERYVMFVQVFLGAVFAISTSRSGRTSWARESSWAVMIWTGSGVA